MNADAFEAMIVPAVRGLFAAALLGGAVVGLARMLGAIAACLREPAHGGLATVAKRPSPAPESGLVPDDESLAAAGA